MGRKKLETNYFDETYSWNIRLRKAVLKKFLEAFHKEKSRRRGKNKGYFINGVVSELMLRYVEAVEAKEAEDLVQEKQISNSAE
jgi:hypothetical protein